MTAAIAPEATAVTVTPLMTCLYEGKSANWEFAVVAPVVMFASNVRVVAELIAVMTCPAVEPSTPPFSAKPTAMLAVLLNVNTGEVDVLDCAVGMSDTPKVAAPKPDLTKFTTPAPLLIRLY